MIAKKTKLKSPKKPPEMSSQINGRIQTRIAYQKKQRSLAEAARRAAVPAWAAIASHRIVTALLCNDVEEIQTLLDAPPTPMVLDDTFEGVPPQAVDLFAAAIRILRVYIQERSS